jgi:hypothetical protein
MKTCTIPDCQSRVHARGWCNKHYLRWSQHGDASWCPPAPQLICHVSGCDRPHIAQGWCLLHYQRWQKFGDPLIVKQHRGGAWLRKGYLTVTVDGREKALHRHLMEQHLGRTLRPDEHVHHKNGVKTDNRLDNLEVKSQHQHISEHVRRRWADQPRRCQRCGQPAFARQLCHPHYNEWRRAKRWTLKPPPRLCTHCQEPHLIYGLCRRHWNAWRREQAALKRSAASA